MTWRMNHGYSYSLNMIKSGETTIEIGRNGDRNVYDDSDIVENVLLHSRKNDSIHLTHHKSFPSRPDNLHA